MAADTEPQPRPSVSNSIVAPVEPVSELEPPNGGWRAWAAVLGSLLLQGSSYGFVSACGVFQLYYKQVMLPDHSSQQLGWITTIAIFLIFGVGLPVGRLIDLYGTRVVVGPFAALGVLSVGLLSLCTQYWQILLCQGFAFGLACGGTSLPAVICVTQWFSTKRGLAVGIASCGSALGGTIYPIMVSRLIDQHGFTTAVRWSTLTVGIGMFIGVVCCEGPYPGKKARERAAKQRALDQGHTTIKDPEVGPTASESDQIEKKEAQGLKDVAKSLRHNGGAWLAFAISCFFCTFAVLTPLNYLPYFAVLSGMDESLSQYTLSIINAAQLFGRFIPAALSDHVGPFNCMFTVSLLSALAMLVIWLPLYYHPTNGGIIFFAVFYGLVSGGNTSLASPCVVALADGKVEDLGGKFGIACLFVAVGALVGIPVVGAVADSTGSFAGLIAFSGAMMAVASVLVLISRVKLGGWTLAKKV